MNEDVGKFPSTIKNPCSTYSLWKSEEGLLKILTPEYFICY